MAVFLSPVGGAGAQFCDNNGNPLNGGKLYTYAAGTTTPAATYTSSAGTTFHPNPIILNAGGRVPDSGEIWLADSVIYKFVLKTSADVLIATWDQITGINSNFVNYTTETEVQTATAGQTVFTLTSITYQPGTNNLTVYVDGVNQYEGTSYLETDSTTVTFTAGLHVGALVKFTTAVQTTGNATDASVVSYDPPFTGSEITTVEAKLAQCISVKDFGAASTATAAENATAFLAAINAANGLPISLCGDTYNINTVVSADDVYLTNGTLVSADPNNHCLNLSGVNVTLDGVNITSNFSGTGSLSYSAYSAINVSQGLAGGSFTSNSKCIIRNCKIYDYQNVAVYAAGYDFFDCVGNVIYNLGSEGITGSSCNNVLISGNDVNGVYANGIQHGSGGSADYMSGIIVTANHVREVYPGNATPQGDANDNGIGIELNSIYQQCTVSNNFISNTHSMGISLSSSLGVSVVANEISYVGQSSRSTGFSYRGYASIELANADWCSISKNIIRDPYLNGVVVDKSHNNLIEGNTFCNSEINDLDRASSQYFIRMYGSANDPDNATWGTKIVNNMFDNGGPDNQGIAFPGGLGVIDCYAVYSLTATYGSYSNWYQQFEGNTMVDCIFKATGSWTFKHNNIYSNGLVDTVAKAQTLVNFDAVSAPNLVESCTYICGAASASYGFVTVTTANINEISFRNCQVQNTEKLVISGGGFVGRVAVSDCYLVSVGAYTNRPLNGDYYYKDIHGNSGDRIAGMPMRVYGESTNAIASPIDGDIIFDITPRASGKIGWVYDGNAAAWKTWGAIDA